LDTHCKDKIKYNEPRDVVEVIKRIADYFPEEEAEKQKASQLFKEIINRLMSGKWEKIINSSGFGEAGEVDIEAMFKEMEIEESKRHELFLTLYRVLALGYIVALIEESDYYVDCVTVANPWVIAVFDKEDFYKGIKELKIFMHEYGDNDIQKISEIISPEVDWLKENEENVKTTF
jgi:hypothetical protein